MPDIPDIPPELSVTCEKIAYRGEGVQIYQCTPDGRWAFQSPRASLYDDNGNLAAEHFAGPTWQAADGSTVVGRKIAESTPDDTAIPWLLLEAASNTGDGVSARSSTSSAWPPRAERHQANPATGQPWQRCRTRRSMSSTPSAGRPEFQSWFSTDADCLDYLERLRWPDGFPTELGAIRWPPASPGCTAVSFSGEGRVSARLALTVSTRDLVAWAASSWVLSRLSSTLVSSLGRLLLNRAWPRVSRSFRRSAWVLWSCTTSSRRAGHQLCERLIARSECRFHAISFKRHGRPASRIAAGPEILTPPTLDVKGPGWDPLTGAVEVDETFIGGEEPGLRGGRARGKKSLVGIAWRSGNPRGRRRRIAILENASAAALRPFITGHH